MLCFLETRILRLPTTDVLQLCQYSHTVQYFIRADILHLVKISNSKPVVPQNCHVTWMLQVFEKFNLGRCPGFNLGWCTGLSNWISRCTFMSFFCSVISFWDCYLFFVNMLFFCETNNYIYWEISVPLVLAVSFCNFCFSELFL